MISTNSVADLFNPYVITIRKEKCESPLANQLMVRLAPIQLKMIYTSIIRMENRSRFELISQILEAASNGASKTQITYRAFLSYQQVTYYLSELGEKDLVSLDRKTRTYKTTSKGFGLLQLYKKLGDLMKPVWKELPETVVHA